MRVTALVVFALAACQGPLIAEPEVEVAAEQVQHDALERRNGTAIFVQGWRWHDVTKNMQRLKDMQFTAIILSPHTATCGGQWSQGYDPSNFDKFWSAFGDESELWWLINTAHHFGLQVYANMVMNHMCTHTDYRYDRFSWNDFHHIGPINDWDDPRQVLDGDLFGLNDLAQESDYVRGELYAYLKKTSDMGFDGFRLDAAKHVPLWYWRDHVLHNTRAWGKYTVGEVYDARLDVLAAHAATGMAVTDYALYEEIKHAFTFGGDLRRLDGAGYAARDSSKALTFVENNDVGPPANRELAYAFVAAYPGYPAFANVHLTDDWMGNLAWVHNHLASGDYIPRVVEKDTLVFERRGNLLAVINQSPHWQRRWVSTTFANVTLHDYSGRASDTQVAADGRVLIDVPPMSYAMYGRR